MKTWSLVVLGGLGLVLGTLFVSKEKSMAAEEEAMLGHMVYFSLKDSTPENRKKLVDACQKYLKDHPGTVFFAAGSIAEEFAREVNVRDWDVALQLVFKNKKAHDEYQDHPRHQQFIAENKEGWKTVKVFDAYVK